MAKSDLDARLITIDTLNEVECEEALKKTAERITAAQNEMNKRHTSLASIKQHIAKYEDFINDQKKLDVINFDLYKSHRAQLKLFQDMRNKITERHKELSEEVEELSILRHALEARVRRLGQKVIQLDKRRSKKNDRS